VDVLGIVNITVAAIAVTLSLIALNSSRRQQRFDAILRVEEFLLQQDVVNGRRLLYESTRQEKLPEEQEDIHKMIQAMARFDSAAILVKNRLVPKSWMLETWHLALRELQPGIQRLIEYQYDNWKIPNPWPTLTKLIEEAREFKCHQEGCCRSDSAEAQRPSSSGLAAVRAAATSAVERFLIRSPRRRGLRASSQIAMPAVLSGSGRRSPRSTTSSGTRRARPSDP
jgi:hypothetical protein